MSDLVTRAVRFATEAHTRIDQMRKYTGQPYQDHLKAVAKLVASVGGDEEMIAAAWLHDTVEDTQATFGDIEREFGAEVCQLVEDLTDVSKASDGNRAVRKKIDRDHTALASPRAQTVKLADLIDNCGDICRHDPRFARVYLREASALLAVLTEGDERLYACAREAIADCAGRLGLPLPSEAAGAAEEDHAPTVAGSAQQRKLHLFTGTFTAADIAEPLRSFDRERPAAELAEAVAAARLEVAGLRREGRVDGYLRGSPAHPAGENGWRRFAPDQVIGGDAPLSEVIAILTRHDFCFVSAIGDVVGVITRSDIQKPVGRTWLFGIVTFIEMEFVRRIRKLWPDGAWTGLVSPGRLDKAQALLEERRRRGHHHVDLLDCLQFSDKGQIVVSDASQRTAFGFTTKGAAQRVIRDLESLRNNLAHAQDIVTHDWPQIARLAKRIEESAQGPE